eukprot:GHVL01038264.1.p1 GENE.GHVL01038264.1~~GHVL01038264.1.p1  ORF type:complete len:137 (-),score=29.97 GHVL01038264.1:51-461(-)
MNCIKKLKNFQPLKNKAYLQQKNCVSYDGRWVTDEQLVKKHEDWAVEETNFCFGRIARLRYRMEDDLARRTMHLLDAQTNAMHTRLRDGTVIPAMFPTLDWCIDTPYPVHTFLERPLLKATWDETYEDAYESDIEA